MLKVLLNPNHSSIVCVDHFYARMIGSLTFC